MEGFTFYKSYWQTAQAIPDPEQRLAYLEACIAYTLEDEEPEGLPAFANIAFTAVRPSLDKSKARSETGKQKGAAARTESEAKQTEANKSESKRNEANKSETHTDTVTVTDTDTVTENNNNVRRTAPVNDAQLSGEFEKLWNMYPKDRRRGKKKAAAAYKRVRTRLKNPVSYTDVLLGINRYNAHIAARHIESQYVLQGETYFCNERWNDEYGSGGSSAPVGKWEQGANRNDYSDDEFKEFERIAGAGINEG